MVKHPAKYSDELMPILKKMIGDSDKILDPFAGTGKLASIAPTCTLLEIEPEWAALSGAIVGDATDMPFPNCSFDVVCTSPTYGNRMADSFVDRKPDKKYKRNTYTHVLGRKLSDNNSGAMQWGVRYRELHEKAWLECYRVLKPNGALVLNISNHIRNGCEVDVTAWHESYLKSIGFIKIDHVKVPTKRNGFGANREARVSFESVIKFKK